MNLRLTTLKKKIESNHSAFAISQTVYLHTRRTTNIDDLTPEEIEALYNVFFPAEISTKEELVNIKNQQNLKYYRSNILTLATRLGIKEPDSWNRFNDWMLKSSLYKKKLNDHKLEELKALQIQFRGIESNYERSANTPGTKAWYHKNKLIPPSAN
ncbi:hypothetical protein [Chryseobacterium mulctrae]|uniref:hypothetical protein n=1 Tax=Chryseobacterium mulctrae TaxID=2576777 RepID=UPI0011174B49|nr:hypothetical protein [Chryseobacterium mulctrae]